VRPGSDQWNLRQAAETTARAYDRLGLFVREGLVPVDLVAAFYVAPVVDGWLRLHRFIEAERVRRGQPGHMWEFENLVYGIILPGLSEGADSPWAGVGRHEGLEQPICDGLRERMNASRTSDDPGFLREGETRLQWLKGSRKNLTPRDEKYNPPHTLWRLRRWSQ
jgi:hypothetical protein